MHALLRLALGLASLLVLAGTARAEFVLELDQPSFRTVIPSVPPMTMAPHPMRATAAHLRLFGMEGPYAVSVMTPTADAGMGAEECATSLLRDLLRKPITPPEHLVHRERINAETYLVLYVLALPGLVQLHAHLYSAAGGTHCVDVHVSKMVTSAEEVRPWFTAVRGARIEPVAAR